VGNIKPDFEESVVLIYLILDRKKYRALLKKAMNLRSK